MKYSQAQTNGCNKTITGTIFVVWLIAAAVGVPILFGLNEK